jgi:hypothetical protein
MERLKPGQWSVNLEDAFDDTIPIMEADCVVACVWPFKRQFASEDRQSRKYAKLIAAAPDLADALENAVATIEMLMACYGNQMPSTDQTQQTRIVMQARQALGKAGFEVAGVH